MVLQYIGAGMSTGDFGIVIAITNQITAYFRYRKLQKKLMSGKMDEELIRAEVCQQVFQEKQKIWHADTGQALPEGQQTEP